MKEDADDTFKWPISSRSWDKVMNLDRFDVDP